MIEKYEECPSCGREWAGQYQYDMQYCRPCEDEKKIHKINGVIGMVRMRLEATLYRMKGERP